MNLAFLSALVRDTRYKISVLVIPRINLAG